jgi:hypothetical protein
MWSESLIVNFLIDLLAGFVIFFVGLRWRLIASYLSRERAAFRRLFGAKTMQAGIATVTLDVYRDIRLLPRESLEKIGMSAQWSTKETKRYFKVFPDGHSAAIPGTWSDITGYCSARAATYLVDGLQVGGMIFHVVSDVEVASNWGGSFINIGSSASNIKTNDLIQFPENSWLRDDLGKFVLDDGQEFAIEDRSDKGIILKLRNPYARGYSVLVCAGLGEWGTSGAAWFFARNWRLLSRRFGDNPFLVITSVTPGSDMSAREIFATGKESRFYQFRSRFGKRTKLKAATTKRPTEPPRGWRLD